MRSVEWALARDYWWRGAISFPVALLVMIALPVWLLTILNFVPLLGPTSREAVAVHVTLTLAIGFGAVATVAHASGRLNRFFMRPISSARLVTCQLGFGMATVAAMYVLAAAVINMMGGGWPVIGPTLFLATSVACTMAVIWSLEGNVLAQLLGCCGTSISLIVWFSRRYGAAFFGDWNTMWLNPTAAEAVTLGTISALAWGVAVHGVARVRHGDVWDCTVLVESIEQWFSRSRGAPQEFPFAWRAQFWADGREKMVAAPAGFLWLGMVIATLSWLAGGTSAEDLVSLMIVVPIVAMTVATPLVYGVLVGNCGSDKQAGMRHFLATLPVTDSLIACSLLRTSATALALAWGTWFAGLALAAGLLELAGRSDAIRRTLNLEQLTLGKGLALLIGALIVSWTVTTLTATLIAAGRKWLVVSVIGVVVAGWCVFGLLKGLASDQIFNKAAHAWLFASGVAALIGTPVAYVAAARQKLISLKGILLLATAWMAVATLALMIGRTERVPVVWRWHILGVLALAILPFAAMPLAVQWNRRR